MSIIGGLSMFRSAAHTMPALATPGRSLMAGGGVLGGGLLLTGCGLGASSEGTGATGGLSEMSESDSATGNSSQGTGATGGLSG